MTQPRAIWTWIAASVAVFMVSMDNLIVTNALPVIRVKLGAGLEGLEWTVNAYTLSFAVLLLTGAALGPEVQDRDGVLILLLSAILFLDLPLYRQAVTVPAGDIVGIVARHLPRAVDDVF